MAIYSSGYPLYHMLQLRPGDDINTPMSYEIYITGTNRLLYTGTVFSKSNTEPVSINIMPILRQYLDTFYEALDWNYSSNTPSNGDISDMRSFTVASLFNQSGGNMSLYDIPNGYNLSGKTITFDTTRPAEIGHNLDGPSELRGLNFRIIRDFLGTTRYQLAIEVNNVRTIIYDGNTWLQSSFTFPVGSFQVYRNDSNNLYVSGVNTSGIAYWGFDLATFPVESGASIEYNVLYDYNTDYISILPDDDKTNNLITNLVHPNQILTFAEYTNTPRNNSYSLIKNGSTLHTETMYIQKSALFTFNLYNYTINPGDLIEVERLSDEATYNFKVVKHCEYPYCLYYVNKSGGLDWLLVKGIEEFNRDEVNAYLYSNRLNRTDFEATRLSSDVIKYYNLETPILNNEESERIDHLLNSPKVWIMDLTNQVKTSCLIEDKSFRILKYPRESTQYKFRIYESQKYHRN